MYDASRNKKREISHQSPSHNPYASVPKSFVRRVNNGTGLMQ